MPDMLSLIALEWPLDCRVIKVSDETACKRQKSSESLEYQSFGAFSSSLKLHQAQHIIIFNLVAAVQILQFD